MTAPATPLQRRAIAASAKNDGSQALAGSWRDGYGCGYRHGHHDGHTSREREILEATADAAHDVGRSPAAADIARARGRVDRTDVGWDAYSVTSDGQRVWDDDARGALLAWCLADWEKAA